MLFMANVSYDINDEHPGPPVFYAKWQDLARAVGMAVPTDDSAASEKKRKALASDISDIRKALVDKGALVRGPRARPGVNAEFAVALDPATGYKFSGSGRNVQWLRISRPDPRPPAMSGSLSGGTSSSLSKGTTGSPSEGGNGSPPEGPPERTPGRTHKHKEEEGETQATLLRADPESDGQRHHDEDLPEEAERQRQLRQLQDLMAKESAAKEVTR